MRLFDILKRNELNAPDLDKLNVCHIRPYMRLSVNL